MKSTIRTQLKALAILAQGRLSRAPDAKVEAPAPSKDPAPVPAQPSTIGTLGYGDEEDDLVEVHSERCYLYASECPPEGRLLTRADLVLMGLLSQKMKVSDERLIQAFRLQPDDAAVLFSRTGPTLETVLEVYLQAYPLAAGDAVEAAQALQLLDSLLSLAEGLLVTSGAVPLPGLLEALFEVHDAQPLASERMAGNSRVAEAKKAYRWMNAQPLGDLQEALQEAHLMTWGIVR